jgi:molecular chaperone GrpE
MSENDQRKLDEQNEEEMIEFEENAIDELASAKNEIADLKDKHLRAVAELQNMQRRNQRDVEDATKYGVVSAAKPLLTVSDNLHRALAAVPDDLPANIQGLFEGIRATERSLQQALEKMGVVAINATPGQALNPHEHEVMFEVDTSDTPHGHIVQVLEAGYKIHDRLLRPARVSVAKNINGVADKTVDFSA